VRYVCTRTCTDFSGRFWETGSIVEFTDGERVPKWFSLFDPKPLAVDPPDAPVEPPEPVRPAPVKAKAKK